jgi:hypothetical protein
MSGDAQPPLATTPPVKGYQAGVVVARPLPDEMAVPLRKDQFDILCEGGIGEARASRDLCIGVFFGTLAGLVGVVATADWDTVWKPERRWLFLLPVLVLCMGVAGSAVGACIHWVRLSRADSDSPYSRVRKQLSELFSERGPPVIFQHVVPSK